MTTLRFYEKELPGLFPIVKTRGGHRRYQPLEVARFSAVRRLTESGVVKLSQVRRAIASRGDYDPVRQDLELLRKLVLEQSERLEDLARRLSHVESRVGQLEAALPRRRGWFK